MCGIVGMAGDIGIADRKIFRDMMDVCQLRGRDSSGVINVSRALNYGYFKAVGPPAYMFDRKSYYDTIESAPHAAFVGHCRHKTSGKIDVQSAHPFDFEDEGIIGVHNGTLTNYHKLDGHTYQKVDSEVLYGHLAKHGPENTFNQIDGAWACVWWNNENETLNFIRNDKRPLWFTWSACKRKLFWASEAWMFGAVERHIDLWKGEKDDWVGQCFQIPVDTLWSIQIMPTAAKGQPTIKFKQPKKIEKEAPAPFAQNQWTNRRTYGGRKPLSSTTLGVGSEDAAANEWNKFGARTHKWDAKTHKFIELMPFSEFKKKFDEEKASGGQVPNPFGVLDDQLPRHLLPKPETLALIQGEKKNTGSSTPKSTTPSQSSSDTKKEQTSTTTGETNTSSLVQQSLRHWQKTNKNASIAKPHLRLVGNSLFSSTGKVSFRSVAGLGFVTDENTGVEYSEQQVQENTQGFCSFCDEPIGDLTEIHEFFSPDRFICTHCVEPELQVVA